MPSNEQTVLMDRSRSRVPAAPPFAARFEPVPAPGTAVWYGGRRFARKIGIGTGRIGFVDGPPIAGSGLVSVSFERLPKEPKPGEEIPAEATDKAPEGFILKPRSLRPVPAAVLAKREDERKAALDALAAERARESLSL
jgi:hypothetical protein